MIGIASDHNGVLEKEEIIKYLEELEVEYKDFGTNTAESVDYVDYAMEVASLVSKKKLDKGILICKTGIGMSIAANKFKGVRCARVVSEEDARLTREHNNANMMSLPSYIDSDELKAIIKTFINTPFSDEEKHKNRVKKINKIMS